MMPIPIRLAGTQPLVIAQDQPQYRSLPAAIEPDGIVHICWQLSWCERLVLLLRGKLWHSVLTFNSPLQPIILSVNQPTTT